MDERHRSAENALVQKALDAAANLRAAKRAADPEAPKKARPRKTVARGCVRDQGIGLVGGRIQVFSTDERAWFVCEVMKELGSGDNLSVQVVYEDDNREEVLKLCNSMIVKEAEVVWCKADGFPWWPGQIWRDIRLPAKYSFVDFLGVEDKMEWLRGIKTVSFDNGLKVPLKAKS